MKKILGFVILTATACVSANDLYDPTTGIVYMPNVQVGSERFNVQLQHQGNLVFSVASAVPITMPTSFSMDWLSGKTLYVVWFGGGDDDLDVGVVKELVFNSDGTLSATGILNSTDQDTAVYGVDVNGNLYFNGDSTEYNSICGSTSQYLITNYYVGGQLDGVDAFFFNKEDALNAARLLGGTIPPCS